jgi:heme exporter protein A
VTALANVPATRLQAHALACSRGHATLFRDISFEIDAGQWISVRGPNGSGKTTLLRCVAGLTRPDRGEVAWKGIPVSRDRDGFHADLLYAGHLPGIKDDLTAEENLRGLLKLRAQEVTAEAAGAALAEVGLDKRRHLPARRLSAGQRRRIGLARLLLDNAACWLLDEPLTALDDAGQQLFARALRTHLELGGVALVATHHDLPVDGARELLLA